MNKFIKQIIILLALFIVNVPVSGDIIPLGWTPLEFYYDLIERTESSDRNIYDYQIGLYRRLNRSYPTTAISSLFAPKDESISIYGSLTEFISASDGRQTKTTESLRAGFSARPFDKLQLFGLVRLDEGLAEDPTYRGKKWRGLAGVVDQAFVTYNTKTIRIAAGRFSNFWGIRKSLLFSSARSLDGIEYTAKWGRLSLSYRLAQLDNYDYYIESTLHTENRFLAAHRLDLHLRGNLRIGFFETAVFGGPGRTVDFYYLNPILFYHGDQLNSGVDDNTFLGFDFTYSPTHYVKSYGQVMVDDFQLDNNEPGDNEPNQYALRVGFLWTDWHESYDLRFEYTRVTNWTFNQPEPRNRYLNNSQPIGDVLGNDYDLISFAVRRWWNEKLNLGFKFEYQRQGEGRIENSWSAVWLTNPDYSEKFPLGVVEYSSTSAITLKGFLTGNIFINGEAGYRSIKNELNQHDASNSYPFVELRLSAFLVSQIDISR